MHISFIFDDDDDTLYERPIVKRQKHLKKYFFLNVINRFHLILVHSARNVSIFLFVFLNSVVQKCRDIVFKLHVLLQIVEIESQAVF